MEARVVSHLCLPLSARACELLSAGGRWWLLAGGGARRLLDGGGGGPAGGGGSWRPVADVGGRGRQLAGGGARRLLARGGERRPAEAAAVGRGRQSVGARGSWRARAAAAVRAACQMLAGGGGRRPARAAPSRRGHPRAGGRRHELAKTAASGSARLGAPACAGRRGRPASAGRRGWASLAGVVCASGRRGGWPRCWHASPPPQPWPLRCLRHPTPYSQHHHPHRARHGHYSRIHYSRLSGWGWRRDGDGWPLRGHGRRRRGGRPRRVVAVPRVGAGLRRRLAGRHGWRRSAARRHRCVGAGRGAGGGGDVGGRVVSAPRPLGPATAGVGGDFRRGGGPLG